VSDVHRYSVAAGVIAQRPPGPTGSRHAKSKHPRITDTHAAVTGAVSPDL